MSETEHSAATNPPVDEKPYRIIFEGKACIGTGECAQVSENWEMNLSTGKANVKSIFITEDEFDENLEAAQRCPAKNGIGVIHLIDRESGKEIYPDPEGDGTVSIQNS